MPRKTLMTALLGTATLALIAASPAADLNKDGVVTQPEFVATALNNFTSADVDGDGFLTKEEHKALRKSQSEARQAARADRRFEKLDANGDGAITREEADAAQAARMEERGEKREARRAEILEKYDTDQNGELSEAERQQLRAEGKKMRKARGFRGKDKADGKRSEARREGRPKLDADADGMISQAEYLAMADTLFARMDANGDGQLEKGEGRKGKKGKRKGPRAER